MLRNILVALLLLLGIGVVDGQELAKGIREGDIIFQKIPCGNLCDAIIETTPCKPGRMFNHCGIVHVEQGRVFVIEAIGKAVKQTGLNDFLKRDNSSTVYVGRMKAKYRKDIEPAVAKAKKYIGTPYDNTFMPGDSALYCSELVWACYNDDNKSIFSLAPMTFISPSTGITYPAWTAYYSELHAVIPEGVDGINPCAIANSDKLDLLTFNR